MDSVSVAILGSLVHLIEEKNGFLSGHPKRVAQPAATVAAAMDRTDDEVESVRLAGRLHDIGMICVPDEIPAQQRPLTPEEFAQIKRHPLVGAQIVAGCLSWARWPSSSRAITSSGTAAVSRGTGRRRDSLGRTAHRRGRDLRRAHRHEAVSELGAARGSRGAEALRDVVSRGEMLVFVDEHSGTVY